MKEIVERLQQRHETITTMESCTGGFVASEITNISGSSDIFQLGLVTYSNETKIQFGVSKQTIETYTVYSQEVAKEMAKCACQIAEADWGIGTTGMIGRLDPQNPRAKEQKAYYAIYQKSTDTCQTGELSFSDEDREKNKQAILERIRRDLLTKLNEEK